MIKKIIVRSVIIQNTHANLILDFTIFKQIYYHACVYKIVYMYEYFGRYFD